MAAFPGGEGLASGGHGRTIKIWTLRSRKARAHAHWPPEQRFICGGIERQEDAGVRQLRPHELGAEPDLRRGDAMRCDATAWCV